MRVLIAGAGKTARELLRRLAAAWRITLIDQDEAHLREFYEAPQVSCCLQGDASSPVVLEEAGLTEHDFVVAVTNKDAVNLEVCRQAVAGRIPNIIALVNDSLNLAKFRDIKVRTICSSSLVACDIELFLESPRLFMTTIANGAGEVMEVEVLPKAPAVGKSLRDIAPRDWLVAAIHRDDQLIIPHGDTEIRGKDRLTIVGRTDLYRTIAQFFSLTEPCFPLEYGQQILIPVKDGAENFEEVSKEALYLTVNSKAKGLTVLASKAELKKQEKYRPRLECQTSVTFRPITDSLEKSLADFTKTGSVGCVVSAPKPLGPFARILGIPNIIALAHRLSCPLLISRQTMPYRKILVPCSGTRSTGLALETAIDLARHLDAEVDIIVVVDPLIQSGAGSREWAEESLAQARQIGGMFRFTINEVVREGNVVKEMIAQAVNYDLLIIGSTTQGATLMFPHIGEHLVQDVPCSVLVVT